MSLNEPEAMERMRKIRVLLASRFDYLDTVRIAHMEGAVDGPAASRKVPCLFCKQTGRIGLFACARCGGSGMRPARKADVVAGNAWDEYVEAPLAEARTPLRRITGTIDLRADIARIDHELRKLKVDEYARAGIVADEERWVVRQSRLEREGSYAELRRALDRLERLCPRLRWALRIVYESQLAVELPFNIDVLESLAVAFLCLHMRGQVRIPHAYEEEHAAEKRRSIDELLDEGWKPSRIARVLGVTEKAVKRARQARKA